jgi:GNAT superfamily N-acetyltransferase
VTRIVQLSRCLDGCPAAEPCAGICLRTYSGLRDVDRWLALRREAFDVRASAGREWNMADFGREFLRKPGWSPERMWFAEEVPRANDCRDTPGRSIGSVFLSLHGTGDDARGVIHWLMVAPAARRRGVGRLLVRTLESYCWRVGVRSVSCETHADWKAAVAFYAALGYRPRE